MRTVRRQGRSYPGFNLFDTDDEVLLRVIARGEFKTLRRFLPDKNSGQVSRLLKKVGRTYEYYLTQFGKHVIATGLKLTELVIIPRLTFGQLD